MPVTIHRQWPLVATTIGGQAGIHSICSYDECEFRGRESLPAPRLGTLLESGASTWLADRCNVTLPDIDGDGRAKCRGEYDYTRSRRSEVHLKSKGCGSAARCFFFIIIIINKYYFIIINVIILMNISCCRGFKFLIIVSSKLSCCIKYIF